MAIVFGKLGPLLHRKSPEHSPALRAMADRYFLDTPVVGDAAVLSGAEAHHLAGVMRAKPGDEVVVFDGGGAEFTARVETVGKREIKLAVIERREIDRELRRSVMLCAALPRGDRGRWLVEKAVELGVRRLVPLRAARSVAQPDEGACERMRRTVVEATKQCGRNRLMEIAEPCAVPPPADAVVFADAPGEPLRLLAHPGGEWTSATLVDALRAEPLRPTAFLIGPEGGFTDDEVAAARAAGWTTLDLGARIMRVETAAAALAAWAALG